MPNPKLLLFTKLASVNRGSIESLTILRGVAAWAVVLTHCILTTQSMRNEQSPGWISWLDLGGYAVMIFFCLSGFALYLSHKNDQWNRASYIIFLTRRIFRIYPAFLLSFIVCFTATRACQNSGILIDGSWLQSANLEPTSVESIIYLTLTNNIFGIEHHVNNVYWSLPVEFDFYLLFPAFLIILRRSALYLALTTMLIAIGTFLFRVGGHTHTLQMAWIFACGMVVSSWYSANRHRLSTRAAESTVVLSAVAACIFSNLSGQQSQILHIPANFLYGVLAISMVYAASQIDLRGYFPSSLIASFLKHGEISYSIYLFHTPFLFLSYFIIYETNLHGLLAIATLYVIVISGTWLAAEISSSVIEQPGIRLGKFLAGKVSNL